MLDLEGFRAHLSQTSSPRTALAYLADARQLAGFLDGRPITLREVEAWIGSMNHGQPSARTLSRKRASASRLLGFLAAGGDRGAFEALTIMQSYKLTPPIRQADAKETAPITREQYGALRERSGARYRALWDILWWTGARISEVLGDPMTGIPPLGGADLLAMVRQGYVRTRGKGGRRRVLLLPPKGREDLRTFADSLDLGRPAFPMSPQAVNATLHRLGFDAGCHAFRHSFRARLRQAGVSDELQSRLLGHHPETVTHAYGQADVGELLEAVERLV